MACFATTLSVTETAAADMRRSNPATLMRASALKPISASSQSAWLLPNGMHANFSCCQGSPELIHDSDHLLFSDAVAFHHEADHWVLQQASELKPVVRSRTHGGLRSITVNDRCRRHLISGQGMLHP
jgi:hypothetical protein